MRELLLGLAFVLGSIVAIVLASVFLLIVLSPIGYYYCNDYGDMSGLDTQFKVVTGKCYANVDGTWVETKHITGVKHVTR